MREYTVKEFKSWNFEDKPHSGSVVFEQQTEPVDWLIDFTPEVGVNYKGRVVEYESRKGNHRQRFELDVPSKQDAKITASWAIGLSVQFSPDHTDIETVKEYAQALIKMQQELTEEQL